MRAGYISLSAAASAFNLHPLRWHVTKVSSDIGADNCFRHRAAMLSKRIYTFAEVDTSAISTGNNAAIYVR